MQPAPTSHPRHPPKEPGGGRDKGGMGGLKPSLGLGRGKVFTEAFVELFMFSSSSIPQSAMRSLS